MGVHEPLTGAQRAARRRAVLRAKGLRPIQLWVQDLRDPKVLERVGISAEEAERYKAPDAYAGAGGTVAQPESDPAKPRMAYPPEVYTALMGMPDEVLGKMISYTTPPVSPISH